MSDPGTSTGPTPAPTSTPPPTVQPQRPTTVSEDPTLTRSTSPDRPLHPLKEAYLPVHSLPPNKDIRVGIIVAAKPTPKALVPAMYLTIDFGPVIGTKCSSTQITRMHPVPEDLIGTKVCCVVNVDRIRLGRLYSECLVLGVDSDEGETGTVLVRPDPRARIGARVF